MYYRIAEEAPHKNGIQYNLQTEVAIKLCISSSSMHGCLTTRGAEAGD